MNGDEVNGNDNVRNLGGLNKFNKSLVVNTIGNNKNWKLVTVVENSIKNDTTYIACEKILSAGSSVTWLLKTNCCVRDVFEYSFSSGEKSFSESTTSVTYNTTNDNLKNEIDDTVSSAYENSNDSNDSEGVEEDENDSYVWTPVMDCDTVIDDDYYRYEDNRVDIMYHKCFSNNYEIIHNGSRDSNTYHGVSWSDNYFFDNLLRSTCRYDVNDSRTGLWKFNSKLYNQLLISYQSRHDNSSCININEYLRINFVASDSPIILNGSLFEGLINYNTNNFEQISIVNISSNSSTESNYEIMYDDVDVNDTSSHDGNHTLSTRFINYHNNIDDSLIIIEENTILYWFILMYILLNIFVTSIRAYAVRRSVVIRNEQAYLDNEWLHFQNRRRNYTV